jgi:hypothetical protein
VATAVKFQDSKALAAYECGAREQAVTVNLVYSGHEPFVSQSRFNKWIEIRRKNQMNPKVMAQKCDELVSSAGATVPDKVIEERVG